MRHVDNARVRPANSLRVQVTDSARTDATRRQYKGATCMWCKDARQHDGATAKDGATVEARTRVQEGETA